ncbi:hypothetical protein [Streptosporangium sp. NPDC049046]|uniref:hypothetical protein n=1 Tax=unclassified Streptosporangium TaxID=2632669 RepID=UPI00343ACA63
MRSLKRNSLVVTATVGAAILAVTACTSRAEPARDVHADAKARYIAAADALCAEAAQSSAYTEEPPSGLRGEVAELRLAAETLTVTATGIAAVPPPADDAEQLREGFVEPAEALAARLRELRDRAEAALRAGDEGEARKVVELSLAPDANEVALSAFALKYGMRTCAGEE